MTSSMPVPTHGRPRFAPRLTGKGPFSDVYSVMANWGANHGVLTIGHVGADFITGVDAADPGLHA